MMNVLVNQETTAAWDEFVNQHPAATFFHLWTWHEVLVRCFGHKPYYLSLRNGSDVCGVFPLFLVKSLIFGRSLVGIPLGVYGGPIADSPEGQRLLVESALEIAKHERVKYLEIRANPFDDTDWRVALHQMAADSREKELYVTFIGQIDPSQDVNLSRIPRKQRRMVRQGEKHQLRATFDESRLRDFYDVYASSVQNLGTPVFSYSYFETLLEKFRDHAKLLVIEHQGRAVAGVLSFFYRNQVLPYYGGALKESFHLAPNDFMYWELMKYAADKGYSVFDFGRSKEGTGAYNFKRHWGFEPKPLPYQCIPINSESIPDTSPLNPKLQWAIKIWRSLPIKVTNAIGPHIVKHIP